MTEEIKREIRIEEFKCPFCGFKKVEKVNDEIFSEQTGESVDYGIDYWDCTKCGAENDIGLETFEKEFMVFRKFTDENDWKGLYIFCSNNDFDSFMLCSLAKFCNQQKQFEKAIKIANILIELDKKDPDAGIIIRNAILGIKNMRCLS